MILHISTAKNHPFDEDLKKQYLSLNINDCALLTLIMKLLIVVQEIRLINTS